MFPLADVADRNLRLVKLLPSIGRLHGRTTADRGRVGAAQPSRHRSDCRRRRPGQVRGVVGAADSDSAKSPSSRKLRPDQPGVDRRHPQAAQALNRADCYEGLVGPSLVGSRPDNVSHRETHGRKAIADAIRHAALPARANPRWPLLVLSER